MTQNLSVSFYHNKFHDLSLDDLYDILKIRSLVFNHQQRLIDVSKGECIEIDDQDQLCTHLIGRLSDNQIAVTARLFTNNAPLRLGRLAVNPTLQKHGIGTQLMNYLDTIIESKPIEMNAQSYLIDWYSKLGWVVSGSEFIECGIKHVRMIKNL